VLRSSGHDSVRLIGTAGHIDHGKSTLVQALTGIHPSHLPEEHAREMTIDLGYAHLEHPDGYRLGVVDVPGHEGLVRNMVAGATGFELALWVVDAREGVMPQSREHLQILELLDVRCIIPVLTKADLASAEQVEFARNQLGALLAPLGARVQPVHVVDSVSGRGIAELKRTIFDLCRGTEAGSTAPPYLPIDRVFKLKGIGTVVTGTLMRGQLAEGDQVAISSLPGTWRVRSLDNHHTRVREIGAGHRVGINLAGLDAAAVRRGDALTSPEYPYVARFINVRLRFIDGVPFEWKHGLRVLFHVGAAEMESRLWGVAGEDGMTWAQVELPRELPFFAGQRFILRSTNPLATLGGGEVLDLTPDRPRRVTPAERSAYASRQRGEPWLESYLAGSGKGPQHVSSLARRWMVAAEPLARQAEASDGLCIGAAPSREVADSLVWRAEEGRALLGRLADYVSRHPRGERLVPFAKLARELGLRRAPGYGWLRHLLARDEPPAPDLRANTRLERAGLVLYPGQVLFTGEEQRIARRIVGRLKAEGLHPSRIRDLRRQHARDPEQVDRVLAKLRATGQIVLVSPDFALHPMAEAELRQAASASGLDGLSVAEFGRALGLSRKHSIPFLEYLNEAGILRRDGDRHYLARASPPVP
jgi:selenocysteine-specific elongation factor